MKFKKPTNRCSVPMRPYALTLACKRKFEALAKEGMIFVMYATLLNRILRNPSPNLELAMYAQKNFGIFRILEGLIEIIIPDNIVHPPRQMKIINILDMDTAQSRYLTRMTTIQLNEVYQRLRFPAIFVEMRSVCSQYAFVMFLARLCHGTDYEFQQVHFGKEATQLSRIFTYVMKWIYDCWASPLLRKCIRFSDR